jgi:hypothetical protein
MSSRAIQWRSLACLILRSPSDGRVLLVQCRPPSSQANQTNAADIAPSIPTTTTSRTTATPITTPSTNHASLSQLATGGYYEHLPPGVWGFPAITIATDRTNANGTSEAVSHSSIVSCLHQRLIARLASMSPMPTPLKQALATVPSSAIAMTLYNRLASPAYGSDRARLLYYLAQHSIFDQCASSATSGCITIDNTNTNATTTTTTDTDSSSSVGSDGEAMLYCWTKPSEVLARYDSNDIRLRSETLHVLRQLASNPPSSTSTSTSSSTSTSTRVLNDEAYIDQQQYDQQYALEVSRSMECIPIPSNTIPPFDCTTLTTVSDVASRHVCITCIDRCRCVGGVAPLVADLHITTVVAR